MDANAFYQKYGFKITDSTTHRNEEYGITREIQKILEKESKKLQKSGNGSIKRLKTLIGKYPNIPHFKNFLTVAYHKIGQIDKAYEINRIILEKHPNYLYGKFNLANEYMSNSELEKIPEILGENLKLNELNPESKIFHTSEVVTFYDTIFRYQMALEDDVEAQKALEIMEAADIDHPLTRRNAIGLISLRLQKMQDKIENRKEAESLSYDETVQTSEPPKFNFPEIEELYRNDLTISKEITQKILALPRKPLIEDLEKVVQDALFRFEYWKKHAAEQDIWDEKLYSFPLHAIFLLVELDAKESLPVIWNLIKQGDNLCEFWFSGHTSETLWEAFYILGKDNLDLLTQFAVEPIIYDYSKSPVHQAICNIALHDPARREEVLNCYRFILETFIERTNNGEEPPYQFMSSCIVDLTYLNAKELLPVIRELYEKDMVDEFAVGDYEGVAVDINQGIKSYKMKRHKDFHARWKHIVDTWYGYQPKEPTEPKTNLLPKPVSSIAKPKLDKKVGRNDPCVCGSGKKFKKCCIRKYA